MLCVLSSDQCYPSVIANVSWLLPFSLFLRKKSSPKSEQATMKLSEKDPADNKESDLVKKKLVSPGFLTASLLYEYPGDSGAVLPEGEVRPRSESRAWKQRWEGATGIYRKSEAQATDGLHFS